MYKKGCRVRSDKERKTGNIEMYNNVNYVNIYIASTNYYYFAYPINILFVYAQHNTNKGRCY